MPSPTDPDAMRSPRRRRWPLVVAGVVVASVVVVGLALFQPWKLWVDDTVDEAVPAGAVPITVPTPPPTTTTTTTAAPTTSVVVPGVPGATASSASDIETVAPPTTTVTTTTTPPALGGSFTGIDHGTSGSVVLLQDATGALFARLEDLDTSNGPDLFVYLSTNPPDGPEGEFDDDFVNLGPLQGNVGSSNYAIPAETDLSRYASVVIWCDRFNSAFGAAPLR